MSTRGDSFVTGSGGWEICYQILYKTRPTAVKRIITKWKPDERIALLGRMACSGTFAIVVGKVLNVKQKMERGTYL